MNQQQHGFSRRRALKGAAWSVPAITLATATPAYAGSSTPPDIVTAMTAVINGGRVTHTVTLINNGDQPTANLVVNLVLTMTATTAFVTTGGAVGHAYDQIQEIQGGTSLWTLESHVLTLGSGPTATPADPDELALSFLRVGPQLPGGGQFTLQFVSIQPATPTGFSDATVMVTPGSAQPVATAPWA
jgi:hypothetical protein